MKRAPTARKALALGTLALLAAAILSSASPVQGQRGAAPSPIKGSVMRMRLVKIMDSQGWGESRWRPPGSLYQPTGRLKGE